MTGDSNRLRRCLVFVAVLAIVTQSVMAGPAMAATTSGSTTVQPSLQPDCGESQVEKAVQFLSPAYALYDAVQGGDECDVEEVLQGNQEQEMQDIHANAETIRAYQQSTITAYNNALNDARTVAWTKSECATLDALESNRSQETTRQWARENITDYYSRLLQNVVADRNAKMAEISYLWQVRVNESLSYETLGASLDGGLDTTELTNSTVMDRSTIILPNGTNVTVHSMEMGTYNDGFSDSPTAYGPATTFGNAVLTDTEDGDTFSPGYVRFYSTYNNSTVEFYNSTKWTGIISEIRSQNQQMLSNANQTVNGLYGSYVRGNLNISDYRSVQCTAEEVGVGVNDTYYSIYAVEALAKAGAETPDLNATGSMTINTAEYPVNGSNGTYTGLLVGTEAPNGSWQVGQTYDPDNINGTISFHVESSNRSFFLNEPFTLVGATGSDGGNISTVDTTEYNYRTDNFSNLSTKLDQLIQLRMEQQERIEEASNGGGGGGIGWPDLGDVGVGGISIVLLGGVAIVLFASDRLPI